MGRKKAFCVLASMSWVLTYGLSTRHFEGNLMKPVFRYNNKLYRGLQTFKQCN
jgi:hypothetical protein